MEKDSKKQRIKTRRLSIETKMAMSGIMIGLVICAVLSFATYYMVSEDLTRHVQNKVSAFAEIIAAQTDGDLFEQLLPGDETTEVYQNMQNAMSDFFSDQDVTYVYSLRSLSDQEVAFVVAADPAGEPCLIGETYDKQKEMKEALGGKVSVTKEAIADEWGIFYTAYAPIYNTQGKVVGIIGVDCESSNIQHQTKVIISKLLGGGLIVLSFVVAINIILARRVGKNIYTVNQKLMDVVYSDGDLTKN